VENDEPQVITIPVTQVKNNFDEPKITGRKQVLVRHKRFDPKAQKLVEVIVLEDEKFYKPLTDDWLEAFKFDSK
jgi:hypothetical protein